ncbi:phenylalanine 4-monooxygenase [Marinobacterium nitratireducens]|uniref:Phenylalanine-4-hydroxylase n=1 Tax=Marinobacterium nitratireducens TaxID=518897 RepID=A0A917ZG16_9GAMM|nr:phenylalanine 4-monooxygenase [Marinobacterium nitratireducens]GGO81294.1 phenylalanine 4-monooxygenase [Marinobacterium nitratireducens]
MGKGSKYVSHKPGPDGHIEWSAEENAIWRILIERQLKAIEGKACDEYLAGLERLDLPRRRIPQLEAVSARLRAATGWSLKAVPALISFDSFFQALANRQFPVATFIRRRDELDYLQEPDIFHEIFGHCPLLTNPAFAHFTHTYGRLGYAAGKEERVFLARLYWMTVEFGLLNTPQGLRIYGGGILSSPGETEYAVNSPLPERKPFDILEVMRTPYRIDIMQPIYFVIDDIAELYEIAEMDLMAVVQQARALGLRPPRFDTDDKRAG